MFSIWTAESYVGERLSWAFVQPLDLFRGCSNRVATLGKFKRSGVQTRFWETFELAQSQRTSTVSSKECVRSHLKIAITNNFWLHQAISAHKQQCSSLEPKDQLVLAENHCNQIVVLFIVVRWISGCIKFWRNWWNFVHFSAPQKTTNGHSRFSVVDITVNRVTKGLSHSENSALQTDYMKE